MSVQENNIRREPTPVESLSLGMYVTELDRSWLGTPFLLQGFLIENEEQIRQLQECCKSVYIDRALSTGNQHATLQARQQPKDAVIRRQKSETAKQASSRTLSGKGSSHSGSEKITFFDILRDLNPDRKKASPRHANVKSPQTPSSSTTSAVNPPTENHVRLHGKSSESEGLNKAPSQGFLGSVAGWFSRLAGVPEKKLKGGIPGADKGSTDQASNNPDVITIYDDTVPVEEEIATIYPVFEQSQIATRELFESLATREHIDVAIVNETIHSMAESIERNPDALIWLSKLKQTNDYAYNHALTVSIHLMALAHFISLPKEQVKELGLAGLLQDVGKLKIDPLLLNKTGKLSPDEVSTLKNHVQLGLDMLNDTSGIPPAVLDIIARHHERVDGSGYPGQLAQGRISLKAQMAGIIDTYCALTTDKAYAKAVYNQKALDELYGMRGKSFSEALVDQLIQFMGIYPVSSLVELNTGEVGVVIQQNRVRRLQPRVMILLGPDKSPYEYPPTLDLINMPLTPSGEPYKIAHGLSSDSYGLNPADFYL